MTAIPSAWALNITGNLIVNYGQSLTDGHAAQNSAEDCLSLAIWTPANATAESKLPVLLYLTGGADQTGGVNIPTQLPPNMVSRSQKHIVVTTNYRVNIFGYPNARGLNQTNLGLLDQRLAVEWVSDNIDAFGGDPERITLWGQSAGAAATDMYLFAFPEDPIIRASISSSGVALGRAFNQDSEGSNFTFVAKAMGCDFEDADSELQCMRTVPIIRILNFMGQYQDNSTLVDPNQDPIAFTRRGKSIFPSWTQLICVADEQYVFSNYSQRYQDGQIAQIPKIIGTTSREAPPLLPYPVNNLTEGPSPDLIVSRSLATVCAAHNTSVARNEAGLQTWRYEWAGNFTNLSPLTWLGAYHYSDLYMLFGTYPIAPGPIPTLEMETSAEMQDLLVSFVLDPASLPDAGWPEYNTSASNGGQLAQFGADGRAVQYVSGDSREGACYIAGQEYDTTP